jgi:hypothetical protein
VGWAVDTDFFDLDLYINKIIIKFKLRNILMEEEDYGHGTFYSSLYLTFICRDGLRNGGWHGLLGRGWKPNNVQS